MNQADEDLLIAAVARIRPTYRHILLNPIKVQPIPPHLPDQPPRPRPVVNPTIIPKSKRRRR